MQSCRAASGWCGMGVKLAIAASLLITLGGAGILWSWWRQAERELDSALAAIETMRAADAAGRAAVQGYADTEKGAKNARKAGEHVLEQLDGADDAAFWLGIERMLAPDANDGHRPAGNAADSVR